MSGLIESANYSNEDKEALKSGLSVAIPVVTSNEMTVAHVSQETVDIQIKKLQTNFPAALTLVTNLAQCLDDQAREFVNSKTFQRLPLADRDEVLTYLGEAVEQYRARSFETLLRHYGHALTVPADVPQSLTNAQYRSFLSMAIRTCLQKQPVPTETHYTLQAGDSLAFIARIHNVSSAAILAANPGLDPIRMRIGQVIVVPPPAPAAPKTRAATKDAAPKETAAALKETAYLGSR
jgi:LysM repeat protein